MGGFFVVSDDLVNCVRVVCVFVALCLAFDEEEGYTIDKENDVWSDVLVAVENVLVCYCVGVVLWIVVVDEFDVFVVFIWSKAN